MPLNELMLEALEELVDPADAVLDDQIEDMLDAEEDIMLGVDDEDDEIAMFIDKGQRLSVSDPINFTDDEIDDIIYDEELNEE